MEDIAPQLIQAITNEFHRLYDGSSKIRNLLAKVKQRSATYAEAQEYSLEVSRLIGVAYKRHISSAVLPDGRMYYNIAERLIPSTLDENYELVSNYAVDVQQALNKNAGIGLKVQTPELDQDRVDGLVDLASNAEHYDDVAEQLLTSIENFSQHIVDETIRQNAEAHYNKGLSPKIIRKSHGKCCAWCRELVGEYDYGELGDMDDPWAVFRRHASCRCTVLYDPADGSKLLQNVHTKKKASMEQHIAEYEERERQRKADEYTRKFKRTFQALPEDKAVAAMRKDSAKWIAGLSEEEKRSIRKYTGNGDTVPKLYQRINAMLRGDAPEDNTLRHHADIISEALKRSTLGENIICYRGMSVNPLAGTEAGAVVSFSQFTSTSVISSKSFEAGVSVTIYAPKGTTGAAYVEELSEFPKQREILFDKDCKYVVLSNKENEIELVVI